MVEYIKSFFKPQKPKLDYPGDFAIIDFSKTASMIGVKDDRNKIILRYFINNFGNYELKRYRYSEERVAMLKEIHKIPIYDKTKLNLRFPVFSRVVPGEAQFTISR